MRPGRVTKQAAGLWVEGHELLRTTASGDDVKDLRPLPRLRSSSLRVAAGR
jgi:hypothetical protein